MTPRRFFARAFRRLSYEIDRTLFESAPTSTMAASSPRLAIDDGFDPYSVPMRDNLLSGWFNEATGELFTGFAVGPEDVVADIGCGIGIHARFCGDRGARVILVEGNEAKLNAARGRWAPDDASVEAHLSMANPLPIADASCTRIICNEVLEHVEDIPPFMAELLRIGAPGARYLFCVPGALGEEVLKHIAHPSYFAPPNHIRIIESAEFQRIVTEAGLTIESVSTFGAFRTLWWWLWWCDQQADFTPRHAVLDHLACAWDALLDSANGLMIKRALDQAIPKSQAIVACKP